MKKYFSKHYFEKIKKLAMAHKAISTICLIVILGGGYYEYKKLTNISGETRYVEATVQKGTLVASISGSGQVSALNQIDIKPKASGQVVYIGLENGQTVKAGDLIAELDTKEAKKAVRDAELNLESADVTLQKLTLPADNLSLIQAENTLTQAKTSLEKAYDDGFTYVSNAFLDMPTIMTGLDDIIYGTELSHGSQDNISAFSDTVKNYDNNIVTFQNDAVTKYKLALEKYNKDLADYKSSSRSSSQATIEDLIKETYDTAKTVSDAIKSFNDFLNFVKDKLTLQRQSIPTLLTAGEISLSTSASQINSHIVSLLNIKNTITDSNFTIAEKTETLAKLKRGVDLLDISSQNLIITQRQNSLADARDNLENYYIRAPFDGTLAKVNAKKSDNISSATVVATIITAQKMAEVSLNEIDVAKVKIGQKVMLSFDAVPELSIAGQVREIDTVGTISSGVVTYNVKTSFDSQDDRVKPGMSVSADIITDVKQNTLLVPNSAVKSSGNNYYVFIFDRPLVGGTSPQGVASTITPREQTVEVGLSNDKSTEIISGLKEDDVIVTRIIAPTAATVAAPSLFGGIGGNRGSGGGGVRTGTGR